MPKISIIIPIYKVEKYLRRCLDSVKNQTFKDWNAICIDDGSPDNSGKIADEYAARDKRFIVIHKKNAGVSAARNDGIKRATGKYVMFIDSDDFLHPQTMELAYKMAVRHKSDIVSFTYDRVYRPRLIIRHMLGINTNNIIPWAMRKKYSVNKIKTLTTNNVFEYATESSHNKFNTKRKWLIKHCQTWKNLYRYDLISDVSFKDMVIFEDFIWWSEVLLKNPRVTIMPLPLYFYIPNFSGAVFTSKQLKRINDLCVGLKYIYKLYVKNASAYQMKQWTENFLWFFINKAFTKLKYISDKQDLNMIRHEFCEMFDMGMFDVVPNQWCQLAQQIYIFINNK